MRPGRRPSHLSALARRWRVTQPGVNAGYTAWLSTRFGVQTLWFLGGRGSRTETARCAPRQDDGPPDAGPRLKDVRVSR